MFFFFTATSAFAYQAVIDLDRKILLMQ
jgi:hypothetical protein